MMHMVENKVQKFLLYFDNLLTALLMKNFSLKHILQMYKQVECREICDSKMHLKLLHMLEVITLTGEILLQKLYVDKILKRMRR